MKRVPGDGLCLDCGAKTPKDDWGYETYCAPCWYAQVAAIQNALACDNPHCHICAFRRGFDAAWISQRAPKKRKKK